jgi:hypothetical protein
MKAIILAVALAVVAGCSDPTSRVNTSLKENAQTGRIKTVSAQYFTTAAGHVQDILVLQDTKTGTEYLAVLGAGVTPMKDDRVEAAVQ